MEMATAVAASGAFRDFRFTSGSLDVIFDFQNKNLRAAGGGRV
jgi:hypothetical protein